SRTEAAWRVTALRWALRAARPAPSQPGLPSEPVVVLTWNPPHAAPGAVPATTVVAFLPHTPREQPLPALPAGHPVLSPVPGRRGERRTRWQCGIGTARATQRARSGEGRAQENVSTDMDAENCDGARERTRFTIEEIRSGRIIG